MIPALVQSAEALATLGLPYGTTVEQLTAQLGTLDQNKLIQAAQQVGEHLPDWSHIDAYDTSHEFMSLGRAYARAGGLGPFAALVENGVAQTDLSTYAWHNMNLATDRHSQALNVALMFSLEKGYSDWHNGFVSDSFLNAFFNNSVATAVGLDGHTTHKVGGLGAAVQMDELIAYSALDGNDESTLPFGNTALLAMFNDADDLGAALGGNDLIATADAGLHTRTLVDSADALSQIFVQYAGQLARGNIFEASPGSAQNDVANGVLTYDAPQDQLTVDLSDARWAATNDQSPSGKNIVGFQTLLNAVSADQHLTADQVDQQLKWTWGTSESDVQKVVFSTTNDSVVTQLQTDPNSPDPSRILDVFGDGNDTVTGSSDNNFIAGGYGNDKLIGGIGNDLLIGGAGDDTFVGGGGHNVFIGNNLLDSTADYSMDGARDLQLSLYTDYASVTDVSNDANVDHLISVGEIKTSDYDDSIYIQSNGGVYDLRIDGGGGNDTIYYGEDSSGNLISDTVAIGINSDGIEVTDHSEGRQSLTNIENIELSPANDHVAVVSWANVSLNVDGNWQSNGDTLDFSGLIQGVHFTDGGVAGDGGWFLPSQNKIHYSNFETIIGTSSGDVYDDQSSTNQNVFLGGGADTVLHAGAGSEIDLGANDGASDVVQFSPDVLIKNFGNEDRITFGGKTLYGGLENEKNDKGYAESMGGQIRYGLSKSGDLEISFAGLGDGITTSNTMTIAGWGKTYGSLGIPYLGYGDISLAKFKMSAVRVGSSTAGLGTIWGTWELFGLETKILTGHNSWGNIDPLVLDLNGDGFNLGLVSSYSAKFDTDADLYQEYTGWVGGEDGFLVRDINHNGQIDDSREMFGGDSGSGLAALATLDGNHDGVVNTGDNGLVDFNGDGVIDASDTFDSLEVWQDINQDGIVEAGELKSLADEGIVSFNVASTSSSDLINGNLITATSTFTRSDGTTGADGDAILKLDNQNTTYIGPDITISAAAAVEPDLKGYGTLVSLRQALSVEPSDLARVDAAIASLDINAHDVATLRNDIRPLLAAWADGSPIRNAAGDIVHGGTAVASYADTTVIRANGNVSDYAWNIETASEVEDGQTLEVRTWTFDSGLQLALTTPDGVTPAKLSNLEASLGSPTAPSVATTMVSGVTQTVTTYTFSDGETLTATTSSAMSVDAGKAAAETLQTILGGQHIGADQETYTQADVLGGDVAFMERFLGETLPLHVQPDDPAKALSVVQAAIDAMNQTLDLLSTRVAVQSAAFAPVFSDIAYNSTTDTFSSASNQQLIPTFEHLLTLAGSQADPETWLKSWDPLLAVVIGDFDRGGDLVDSAGFVAQNIVAAYETVEPSFDFMTAVRGFGLDPSPFVTGTGDLQGTDGNDIFYLSSGDQTATGGPGQDNYIIGAHFGHDVINDVEPAQTDQEDDVVRFTNINPDDVTLIRNGEDLTVTVNATGQTLTIIGQFHGEWPDISGGNDWDDKGVSTMIFADGTVWGDIDMASAASHPDAASTTLVGTEDNDVLDGGAGNDLLEGRGDGDIYVFGRGYDNDTISDLEDNPFRPAIDIVRFKDGISESDLVFHRDGNSNDLVITIKGDTADSLTIDGQFAATYTGVFGTLFSSQIEMFTFANGAMLSADAIDQKIIDSLETSGNDTIYGFSREDTIIGGKGDDFLSGGNEDDTYIFNLGDGHDTIADAESNILGGETDTLQFGPGISASDVVFTRDGSDLVATIASTGDSVRISGQYNFTETGVFGVRNFNLIENFTFADGTTKGWRAIMDDILHASETSGNDHVVGTHFGDVIDGGTGDDLLEGGDGDDTYMIALGDGHDTINDVTSNILAGGDDDTIVFGAGITPDSIHIERTGNSLENAVLTFGDGNTADSLTIDGQFTYGSINFRGNEIEHFTFADGTTWTPDDLRQHYIAQQETSGDDLITGFYTNDTLDGGAGNDTLRGGDGNDTYRFELGFGHDRIEESVQNAAYSDNDQIVFGQGLNSTDATLTRSGNDLIIGFAGMTDTVTIAGQFTTIANFDGWQDIENVTFGDGVTWTVDDIRHKLIAQSETSGDDTVLGFWSADTLDGGAGNDLLSGGSGGDTYRFGIGDGQDTVVAGYSAYDPAGTSDTVSFKAGVTADSVTFAISGNDLIVTLAGGADILTVQNQFTDAGEVETFAFADGTTLSAVAVAALAISHAETSGADMIQGSHGADTFDGGAGNDTIYGNGGSDIFLFGHGSGVDTVYETIDHVARPATATLQFKADVATGDVVFSRNVNDLVVQLTGTTDALWVKGFFSSDSNKIDQFVFADGTTYTAAQVTDLTHTGTAGNDVIWGSWGGETLDGKGGNDVIHGNGGSDTFVYAAGYGQLEIDQADTSPDASVLSLSGINSTQVTVARDITGNVTLTDGTSGDSILLDNMANSGSNTHYGVNSVTFADGVTWSATDVLSRAAAAAPSNDNIYGTTGADTIDGHGGDDYAEGKGGGDTFIFNSGYGHLDINEYDSSAAPANVLHLGAGISPSAMTVTGDRWGDIFLADGVTGDRVTLEYELSSNANGVQSVIFADGTTWSRQDLIAKELTGTTGGDNIYGTPGADTIDGHGGSDYVAGKGGDDTFLFDSGYGHLEIDEYDTNAGPHNVLQLGAGIAVADVSVSTDRFGDILLIDTMTGDTVTLDNETSGAAYGVQSVVFADGTTWSRAYLMDAKIVGTTGSDNLRGTAGVADIIDGKGGDDYEDGKGGNDTFVFNSGYGHLEISEYDSASGAANVLQLGTGITPSALTVSGDGWGDIFLTDGVSGDRITIDNEMSSAANGVQSVVFADGTTWSRQDLINKELSGTTGSNNIYGTSGADTIDGHGGGDYAGGKGGGDTFIYNTGYGHLEIDEYDTSGSPANSLHFGAGIDPATISIAADRWGDLFLTDGVSGDQVAIDNALTSNAYGVQSVVFADGTTWSRQDLITKEMTGTSGSNEIYGTPGADTMDGHGGSDTLHGKGGGDVFIYNGGYGHLEIDEYDTTGAPANSLHLGTGILASDIVVTADRFSDLILTDGVSGDQITLDTMLANGNYGVQSVVFADGTAWSAQDLINKELNGTSGDDNLYGTSGADTFVFRPGFGHDTVEDFNASQSDVIALGSSLFVDYDDVMAHAATVGSDVVITYDAADTITLKNVTLANLHATDFHFV